MLVVMNLKATEKQVLRLKEKIEEFGYAHHDIPSNANRLIAITQNPNNEKEIYIKGLPGIDRVITIRDPFKLASRLTHPENSIVKVGKVQIGAGNTVIIAGPCAVEGEKEFIHIAHQMAQKGAHILRGGAYKPRTSPYSFQGLEEEGLKILAKAREETGLPIVTEVVDPISANIVAEYTDVFQIGARNMQNFVLLKKVGSFGKPILLKRGISSTLEEFLMSAEYLMSHGSRDVILCERGIRTFCNHTRSTLDIGIVPVLQTKTHLPIIIDPSHASGNRKTVIPHALAGLAVGADGLIVEVHQNPEKAFSDGLQALLPEDFEKLFAKSKAICEVLGKPLKAFL